MIKKKKVIIIIKVRITENNQQLKLKKHWLRNAKRTCKVCTKNRSLYTQFVYCRTNSEACRAIGHNGHMSLINQSMKFEIVCFSP